MSFIDIVPRDGLYLNYNITSIPLNVIRDDGVKADPDIKIKVTDLNKGKKHFLNQSGLGDKFKISIIIDKEDTIFGNYGEDETLKSKYTLSEVSLTKALDYWIRNMIVMTVRSDSLNIDDGDYIITDNSSRKQQYERNTIWELEFTKYTGLITIGLVKSSGKGSKSKTKAISNSALNKKLKKCNYKKMKYGKSSNCILTLNKKLRKKGYLSKKSWNSMKKSKKTKKFTKATKKAVKKFQKKYNKKHKKKLKANGKLTKSTFNALIKT